MSQKTFAQTLPEVASYVESLLRPEDAVLSKAVTMANAAGLPAIQVSGFDGRHLEVLTRALQARKVVEIGTLGGYSGICLARGLSEGGKLYTFEYQAKHAQLAQEVFAMAEVKAKVEVFVGKALETLPQIEGQGPFDLVFVDADKANYTNYGIWAEKYLRRGGMLIADNTFAWGEIYKKDAPPDVKSLQEFNSWLAQNKSFKTTMLPTGEGLTVAIKL